MAAHQFFVTLTIMMAMLGIASGQWNKANATFYGDKDGKETMYGACGYGNLFQQGYGLETTSLSTALFNNGLTCGACYEIKCVNESQWSWCVPKANSIVVTATNFCPPNYGVGVGWCNPPNMHFDLTYKMFTKIAIERAGVVPVIYRRVPCLKQGGVKFEIKGNTSSNHILVYNVAGAGSVVDVKIKGSNTGWIQMTRDWGQNWQTKMNLTGQSLSFQVTTDDKKVIQFDNIVPRNLTISRDETFDGIKNF